MCNALTYDITVQTVAREQSLSLSLALSLSRSLFLLLRLLLFPRLALNPIAPGEHGDGDDDDSIARTRRSRRETDDPVGEIG